MPASNRPPRPTHHALSRPWRLPAGVTATLLCGLAGAFQPLITDDTGTQGQGGNQLELALNRARITNAGQADRATGLPVVYTRGATDTLDLYVGASYLWLQPAGGGARGAGNPALGAKWRFLDPIESGTSAAIKGEVLLPVSQTAEASGLGNAATGGSVTLILGQEVPFGSVLVNAAAGRRRRSQAGSDAVPVRLSAAPVWQVNEAWKLALDLGCEQVKSGVQTQRTRFVELGTVWSPTSDLDLSLGLIGSNDHQVPSTRTVYATAGATWRFR